MKFKFLLTLTLAGAAALSAMAQGYKDGVEYYKADRLADAEELLNRNLNNADTDKAEAYYYLGQIQLARYFGGMRNHDADAIKYKNEAAKYFNDGVAANPENPFNYVGQGTIALINSNSKEAETLFKKAEKFNKKDAGIFAAVARAYYDVNPSLYAKQMDKALADGKKLVDKQMLSSSPKWAPNDQDYYMLLGDMAFDASNGDSQKVGTACNFYENAISVNPKSAEGYIKYADKLYTVKRFDEATAQLRNLLQQNPNSALGQRELAERLYENGKVKQGIEEYGRLVNNPNHFKSDEDRYMILLYYVNDFQKGYDEATKLLAADPNNFSARRFQYIFAHSLDRPDVLQMAEKLVSLKSDTNRFATGDYALVASDMIKAGRNDEALQVLAMGEKDYPNDPSVAKGAARIYVYDMKQYDKGADMMEKYAKAVGNDISATDLNVLSSYAYYAASNAAKANDEAITAKYTEMSEKAIRQAESKMDDAYKYLIPERLGDLARLKKDNAGALANYLEGVRIIEANGLNDDNKSDAADMYRFIGLIYAGEKKPEARTYLQKYININPNDEAVNKVFKQLK